MKILYLSVGYGENFTFVLKKEKGRTA